MLDSVGMCYFTGPIMGTGYRVGPLEIAELLSAAVGREYSADELLEYGRRAHNVQKAFNTLHAGFVREDDLPPRRFVEEAYGRAREVLTRYRDRLDRLAQSLIEHETLEGEQLEAILDGVPVTS